MKMINARQFLQRLSIATAIAFLLHCPSTVAHEGPPFPVLLDEPINDHTISIWADPDIGQARFFIVLETADGGIPRQEPTVTLGTEPTSHRLESVEYPAKRQSLRNRMQFEAHPTFDQRDLWTVAVRLSMPDQQTQEITIEVESTPPGFGAWDLAIYLFPFALFGGMWGCALINRRRASRQRTAPLATSNDSGQMHLESAQ
ncbi:hypothetical protein NHH03_19100 [Stieleria sp. TO1_6]|uniref:hypothetical protein n=1 Tax=Stieleria tagensis TaxID=2956795 RepID=UPI00209A75A7|nr:hypothetical protein [Stieleria tagensis]MCO8123861.1 hypothetical protein [Stieleria tagensis]